MSGAGRALILVGSPRVRNSVSGALAKHISGLLEAKGLRTETARAYEAIRSDEGMKALCDSFDGADVIVLVFPLYVDSLPAGLTRMLELLAEHRRHTPVGLGQRMLAVCQSGFPDAHQNQTALKICRLFCRDTGIEWAAGLAFGGGGALEGRELSKMGGMVRNVVKALEIACSALAEDTPVPPEAAALMAKPMMPRWLYTAVGSYGWKRLAKRNGVWDKIHARPYERR